MAPPTICRALNALVAGGLVDKVASMNAYVACHHTGDAYAASFLICDCCGGVNEIHTPVGMLLSSIEGQGGFKASHVAIEAHGLCGSCQA